MVRLDRIVTRGGDAGDTSLGDGTRVPKDSLRVEAYGTVDEANAVIGLVRLHCDPADTASVAMLNRIQNDLFDVGADLCVPGEAGARLRFTEPPILRLDAEITALNAELPPLQSFILPGGQPAAAHAHVARTVIRRAERLVVRLAREDSVNPLVIRFLNRLSDHLFVLARHLNAGHDLTWKPGAHR